MSNYRSRHARGRLLIVILTLISSLILMSDAVTHAAPGDPGAAGFSVVTLPPEAFSMPSGLAQAAPTSTNEKMDSDLAALAAADDAAQAEAFALAEATGLRLSEGRVQVTITTDPEGVKAATEAIAAAGGEVTGVANGDTWLQAWLPIAALETIAAEDDIYYISRPAEPFRLIWTADRRVGCDQWPGLAYCGLPRRRGQSGDH